MTLEQTTCEDLKAFERRLVEVIAYYQPQTKRWRVMFAVVALCTAVGAWQWLMDPQTSQVSFVQSLMNHLFFTISSAVLILLFLMGIHRRVVAPSIYGSQMFWKTGFVSLYPGVQRRQSVSVIVSRLRKVLADFNMSCDDNGRLILKPRPTT